MKKKTKKSKPNNFNFRKMIVLKKLNSVSKMEHIDTLIEIIKKCESHSDIDKIFEKLNPIFLFNLRLKRSYYGNDYLTKNSIYKTIYVPKSN